MSARRYARVAYPWKAAVDLTSERPARFYAGLMGQAVPYWLAAPRRLGAVWSRAGRRGLPEGLLARAVRRFPAGTRPDVDEVLERVSTSWPDLHRRSARLPAEVPALSVLVLQRRAALTFFLFAGEDGRADRDGRASPLLVLKVPAPGDDRVDVEAMALEEAASAEVAPRALGRVGDGRAQEGIDGISLGIEPLAPGAAASLRWSPQLAELARGFTRLAERTAKRAAPEELREEVERAIHHDELDSRSRDALTAAWRDVAPLDVSVLRQRDTSPQNCLFDGDALTGVVDWENAVSLGTPGFDVWNSAVAYLGYCVGLVNWSEERLVEAFESAWHESPFWRDARAAGRASALAGGVPERLLDPLEVVFFGRRLGQRLDPAHGYRTGAGAAAGMLRAVCA